VALCVATTILIKMGKTRFCAVTLVPLSWLVAVTFTASYQKIFNSNARIGFLAHARELAAAPVRTPETARLIFNDRLDAAVTGVLVVLVVLIVLESALEWLRVLSGRKVARVHEAPFVPTRFVTEEAS
jgi:carbon starvation protein